MPKLSPPRFHVPRMIKLGGSEGGQCTLTIVDAQEMKKKLFWPRLETTAFIETGTHYGNGVITALMLGCKDIHSVEINDNFFRAAISRLLLLATANSQALPQAGLEGCENFEICRKKDFFQIIFGGNTSVSLYKGDTIKKLPEILEKIEDRATFWLDAHWSGEDTHIDSVLTNHSPNHIKVPIIKELEIIKQHSIRNHMIMIDDMSDVFGSLEGGRLELFQMIEEINPNYQIVTKFKEEGSTETAIIACVKEKE